MNFDVEKIRRDFPILSRSVNGGKRLVYLDNAATAQKPKCVVDAISNFYLNENANIHRSAHYLSQLATKKYEGAREAVAKFLNAPESFVGIFTSGATDSLNLIAQSWCGENLRGGDEILLTQMEHHANIVPWQMAARKAGAKVVVADITPDGALDMDSFRSLLSERTRIVSIAQASNVLGTINPLEEICQLVRAKTRAIVSVDAAQSSPHYLADLAKIDCDFLSLSAHKCYGPTGIGMLFGRREILDKMPPYQGGGDMIDSVSWGCTTFRNSPERFEAGTPHIAGAVGFAAAVEYMMSLDKDAVRAHEDALLKRATERLEKIGGLKIYGDTKSKLAITAFSCEGAHPNDISILLDAAGIAVRTGHHCAEPLHKTLGVDTTCRASFAFYNTLEEADIFADALERALKTLR